MEKKPCNSQEAEVRKGPWTMEEDLILINYIANHGEGVWNSLAKAAGLKRTGKSCRLRWLNYLRPDVRRGNITPEEQLLIMELHAKWGNRWSKIAKHLPGRTDNEIKNFWRTRIQKHMKQTPETFHVGHQYSSSYSEMNNEQATSSSHMSCGMAEPMDTFSPSSSYHHHHHDPGGHQQQQSTTTTTMTEGYPIDPISMAAESNDDGWIMENIWSMQLFNGD